MSLKAWELYTENTEEMRHLELGERNNILCYLLRQFSLDLSVQQAIKEQIEQQYKSRNIDAEFENCSCEACNPEEEEDI